MSLSRAAMRRPVTVLVAVAAVVLAGVSALRQMPRDILPNLGIPIIYVAQPYGGMDPAQMEGFLTYYYEYHFLYVTGIEHVESKSIQGVALLKLQFHPGTNMAQAMAETINYANRARAFMPPGTVPPFIMRFDAGSVPVGNLVFASDTRWTVVRGSDLEEGESQGLPVWSRHVGDPILESNLTRRVDFALFMVEALTNDELVHEAPAIVGCQTPSALAHAASE